jgi:hypothetical protein
MRVYRAMNSWLVLTLPTNLSIRSRWDDVARLFHWADAPACSLKYLTGY